MKAKVKYTLYRVEEIIDLEDFGHCDVRYEDLTDKEKEAISDSLLSEMVIYTDIKTLD